MQLTDVAMDKASHSCLKISGSSMTTFDLDGSRFSNCAEAGILVTTDGFVDVNNVTIDSGSIGVKVATVEGHFKMRNSRIIDMTSSAVDVVYAENSNESSFTLENSVVHNCSSGIQYRSDNSRSNVRVRVVNNSFSMIPANALVIIVVQYTPRNSVDVEEHSVEVAQNTFDNVCDIVLGASGKVNSTFHDNTVENCDCHESDECLLVARTGATEFVENRVCDVSTNVFRNNTDQCLIRLKSASYIPLHATFFNNQLLQNDVTDAAVILESRYFTLSRNRFENPASELDVRANVLGNCCYLAFVKVLYMNNHVAL